MTPMSLFMRSAPSQIDTPPHRDVGYVGSRVLRLNLRSIRYCIDIQYTHFTAEERGYQRDIFARFFLLFLLSNNFSKVPIGMPRSDGCSWIVLRFVNDSPVYSHPGSHHDSPLWWSYSSLGKLIGHQGSWNVYKHAWTIMHKINFILL